jgi:GT2 family glycosyltransferase
MKRSPAKTKPVLTVIVLNYNAHQYLDNCLKSICQSVLTDHIEVIIADNASTDDSFEHLKIAGYSHPKIQIKFLQNGGNIGFAAGNNRAVALADPHSQYIIFLNPDTTVGLNTFQGMIDYLDHHPEIDAATCYITLALTGQLQPECHRGFPTPWNAFCHFFLPFLPKFFPHSQLFNGYFLGHLDYTQPQQIDCGVGAFLMFRRSVGDSIGWWNEKYFMYGEDLDICYQLHQHGYKLFFIPDYKITHYQGISSGIKKAKSQASRETKVRSAIATTNAMRIFYRLNLINDYPQSLHWLVWWGIDILQFYRVFKAKYL